MYVKEDIMPVCSYVLRHDVGLYCASDSLEVKLNEHKFEVFNYVQLQASTLSSPSLYLGREECCLNQPEYYPPSNYSHFRFMPSTILWRLHVHFLRSHVVRSLLHTSARVWRLCTMAKKNLQKDCPEQHTRASVWYLTWLTIVQVNNNCRYNYRHLSPPQSHVSQNTNLNANSL